MQFVDKQKYIAAGAYLLDHLLDTFLKLAAVFGTGDHRRHIQRIDLFATDDIRDSTRYDPLRKPLDDRRLADTRFPDQTGVVFRPPAEDLDNTPDLLLSSDNRIELSVHRLLREVSAEALQHIAGASLPSLLYLLNILAVP